MSTPTKQEEEKELLLIEEFRKGYIFFLSGFQALINSFIQYISSGNISEVNKRDLLPYVRGLDQELNKSQKTLKDIIFNLDEKHLYPTAKKEYSRYFQGGHPDGPKTDFVQFHLIFEMLRNFLNESRVSWNEIRKGLLEGNFKEEEFRDISLLKYRIDPTLEHLDRLAIFVKRMGYVLGIENAKSIFEFRPTKPKFQENKSYKLSSIFASNLYIHSVEELASDAHHLTELTLSKPIEKIKEIAKAEGPESKRTPEAGGIVNYIQAYGSYSWNSDLHYYLRFESDKYLSEREYFKNTISMDTHLGADEQTLRSDLIKSLSSIKSKAKTSDEYENEYVLFLKNFFSFIENIIILNQGIPGQLKWVFLFHIGPSHFYMIVRKFMMEVNTGYIHVKSADGKKVTRMIPGEYIKKHVIEYWRNVILTNVGEEKNNLALFKKIAEVVQEKYKETSANAMEEYNKLSAEIKASKRIDVLFRENMNHWMGAANIIIFKRFVKNKSI